MSSRAKELISRVTRSKALRAKQVDDNRTSEQQTDDMEDQYGNVGAGGSKPPTVPPKTGAQKDEWTILRDFLHVSADTSNGIVEDQVRLVNPTDKDMVRAAVIGKVAKSNFEATKALVKLMAYEGFNPVTVISEMSTRAERWNKSELMNTWVLTLDGLEFTITEKADLANDILFLCTLFLTRGNNLRKILASIEKTVKTPLLVKIKTYGIKSDTDEELAKRKRSEKIDLISKDITLSRVAASFPHIALAVVKQTNVRGKVDLTCMTLQYRLDYGDVKEPPAILTHGLIPSILMKTEVPETAELKRFCFFFNIEQSVTLQMPSAKRSVINEPMSKTLESAEKFVNAAINGPLNSDLQRKSLLRHLGLYNPDDEEIKRWISVGSKLFARCAISPSYYMLQSALSMELATKDAAGH